MKKKQRFYRRFAALMQLFWTAILADALYIFSYIRAFLSAPSESFSRGETLSIVPAMTEHVLMSVTMLLLCACAAELLRRHT